MVSTSQKQNILRWYRDKLFGLCFLTPHCSLWTRPDHKTIKCTRHNECVKSAHKLAVSRHCSTLSQRVESLAHFGTVIILLCLFLSLVVLKAKTAQVRVKFFIWISISFILMCLFTINCVHLWYIYIFAKALLDGSKLHLHFVALYFWHAKRQ